MCGTSLKDGLTAGGPIDAQLSWPFFRDLVMAGLENRAQFPGRAARGACLIMALLKV